MMTLCWCGYILGSRSPAPKFVFCPFSTDQWLLKSSLLSRKNRVFYTHSEFSYPKIRHQFPPKEFWFISVENRETWTRVMWVQMSSDVGQSHCFYFSSFRTFWDRAEKEIFLSILSSCWFFLSYKVLYYCTLLCSGMDFEDIHNFLLCQHSWHIKSNGLVVACVKKGYDVASRLRRKEYCNDWLIMVVMGRGRELVRCVPCSLTL